MAYDIAKETFIETLDDLDKRDRDKLETVKVALKGAQRLEFDRDDVAHWCRKRKDKLTSFFGVMEIKEYFVDSKGEPFSPGYGKRTYILNQGLVNERPTFADVTTPEDLRRKWEGRPSNGTVTKEWHSETLNNQVPTGHYPTVPTVPLFQGGEERKLISRPTLSGTGNSGTVKPLIIKGLRAPLCQHATDEDPTQGVMFSDLFNTAGERWA